MIKVPGYTIAGSLVKVRQPAVRCSAIWLLSLLSLLAGNEQLLRREIAVIEELLELEPDSKCKIITVRTDPLVLSSELGVIPRVSGFSGILRSALGYTCH
jgi:hypothetical protein